jgi:hypothetical protein
MTASPQQLYLTLMKKALSFTLWEDTGYPIEAENHRRVWHKRLFIWFFARLLSLFRLQAFKKITPQERTEGAYWPRCAHTMIGLKRLDNLQFCVEDVLRRHIPGDLIETGVWRGGSCIFMRALLAVHGDPNRRVFVADSFAGLPPPDAEKYPADRGGREFELSLLAVSQEEVKDNFAKYGLLDDRVIFLKGWFKDTLPTAPVQQLAVMRLDGDMYESTMDALNALYAKLSGGGYCIIDDYALPGCRKAVDDFRTTHHITVPLTTVDWSCVYWQKPSSP